jgi:hypothetical protein
MVAMLETLDKVEPPAPEKVALDVPLPARVVMLVVPMPLTVRAFELPTLSEEKPSVPLALLFATDSVFPVPNKLTAAAKVLFADPARDIEDEEPPSRFND